jgi:hypothetical protein
MGSKDVSGRALLHEVGATFVGRDLLHEVDTVSGQILLCDVDTVSGRAFLTRSLSFRARTCFMRLHVIMLGAFRLNHFCNMKCRNAQNMRFVRTSVLFRKRTFCYVYIVGRSAQSMDSVHEAGTVSGQD